MWFIEEQIHRLSLSRKGWINPSGFDLDPAKIGTRIVAFRQTRQRFQRVPNARISASLSSYESLMSDLVEFAQQDADRYLRVLTGEAGGVCQTEDQAWTDMEWLKLVGR